MTAAEREARILSLGPLVKRIAHVRHAGLPPCVESSEVVSAGWLGAINAVDRFDPERKTKLTSYARPLISGAISDYLRSLDPVSRDERRRFKANPDLEPPRTFSITRANDDTRAFDIGDSKSYAPYRRIEARLDLAKIHKASPHVKSRGLQFLMRHAQGETMKAIGESAGIQESRVSQICSNTLTQLRKAA